MEEAWEHLKKQKTPIIDNRSVPTHIKHTLTHIYCAAADRQWGEAEMLVLLQVMYTDLDFLTEFHMELQNFLFEKYCLCVTQMAGKPGGKHLYLRNININ